MSAPQGAQPRNLDYYLQRMSGYSKNTIRIQPQSKSTYDAGDTITFRLPTNSIIDLHTLTLKLSAQLQSIAADGEAAVTASFPRFTQSYFRRIDWTMGGMQAGLGSLHDYGFLYSMLANHKIPMTRTNADLNVTDSAGYLQKTAVAVAGGKNSSNTVSLGAGAKSDWKPQSVTSWLGLPAGNFMRFLDTNILPDIEIRMLLAPNTIIPQAKAARIKYQLKNLSFSVESISFGDGSYRAIVDSRMAEGTPLLVPFFNWAGFEGTSDMTNINQQFTIGTESLNALMTAIRPGNYDSQAIADSQLGGNGVSGTFYIPQVGDNAQTKASADTSITLPTNSAYSWYHTSLSGEKPDQFAKDGTWSANYQYNIDSKLYPQFMADAHDAWHLLRNMFDANALSLTYGSSVQTLDQFLTAYFMFCVGLDHHSDDAGKDHLISGLNTTGSLIPITFTANLNTANNAWFQSLKNMTGSTFRPTVFANMTSTLMIYQGRTITVVN
jgi:hypothetical protein